MPLLASTAVAPDWLRDDDDDVVEEGGEAVTSPRDLLARDRRLTLPPSSRSSGRVRLVLALVLGLSRPSRSCRRSRDGCPRPVVRAPAAIASTSPPGPAWRPRWSRGVGRVLRAPSESHGHRDAAHSRAACAVGGDRAPSGRTGDVRAAAGGPSRVPTSLPRCRARRAARLGPRAPQGRAGPSLPAQRQTAGAQREGGP